MPRKARHLSKSAMLHIIARGNNKIKIFRNRNDFSHFEWTLRRFQPEDDFFIHHYALMHTHFHLLCWLENTATLAKTMKSILISYQYYYRKKYNYTGHLFRDRYRSISIEGEEYFLQCGRYIELNPVHAGICKDPRQYPWSSYNFHAYGKENTLVKTKMYIDNSVHKREGRMNVDYQSFIIAGIDLDVQKLKKQFEDR
ncbi:MAG: hypothetical protein COX62_06765 [Deltaproteobacteria bacterium CG_4_10_14_0_2_um_filter_43_8]|nr:MAG: hypothetical protein COV43_06675 [Deltaproteobacteria bacterium CG11_big_fil_rev_8_21_14_0_20_42_23]PJA19426.1 MAG: hypothetical protein COX62_06765 [Deltaproteobacteria bacterium CG_4_10_14_0_2_um_filter_43_8]PJC64104.1 MAG: hypothetical protein CO021_06015 [Deltaproteobacteria bacterium CG_4_9_14_0_2_um_filter_42_21]